MEASSVDKNRTGRAWDSGSSTKGKDLGVPKYGSNECKPQKWRLLWQPKFGGGDL